MILSSQNRNEKPNNRYDTKSMTQTTPTMNKKKNAQTARKVKFSNILILPSY